MDDISKKPSAKWTIGITVVVLALIFFCAWVGEYGALAANNAWHGTGKELPARTEDAINFYRHQFHWIYAGITAAIAIALMLFRRHRGAMYAAGTGALVWLLLSTLLLSALCLPGACLCDAWMHWDGHNACVPHKK